MTEGERRAVRRLQAAQLREAERVAGVVAWYYGYTVADLQGRRRPADVAEARQVAMWIMRTTLHWPTAGENIPFSPNRVAGVLARDRATVLYGIAAVAARRGRDPQFRRLLEEITLLVERPDEGCAGERKRGTMMTVDKEHMDRRGAALGQATRPIGSPPIGEERL